MGYVPTGVVALTGFMQTAYSGASTSTVGSLMELDAVAACVIGGTSLRGGRGTFVGTVLGAVLLTEVLNAVAFLGFTETYQYVFQGALIVIAALIYSTVRQRAGA